MRMQPNSSMKESEPLSWWGWWGDEGDATSMVGVVGVTTGG